MDENYLDNLLNEISLDKEIDHKIEDELDSQMNEEKRKRQEEHFVSQDEAFDLDLENESAHMEEPLDFNFTEEQMEELDALDNLADLDIGDMDFDHIDFDDVDVTKLDGIDEAGFEDLLKDFEGDLEVDEFFRRSGQPEEEMDLPGEPEKEEALNDELPNLGDEQPEENEENLNEDSFDADGFLDSLLDETDGEAAKADPVENLEESEQENVEASGETPEDGETQEDAESLEDLLGILDTEQDEQNTKQQDESQEVSDTEEKMSLDDLDLDGLEETQQTTPDPVQALSQEESEDLDDILSMLDMESADEVPTAAPEDNSAPSSLSGEEAALLDELDDLEDLDEPPVKKKRTLMQILFGDPDEDDELSPEEMEAIEAKKAEKKAKKAEAKAAKKEKADAAKQKKDLENNQKKKANDEKNKLKAEKKARKKAAAAAEAANAEPEKKLNKPMVVLVFSVFLGGLFLFYSATNNFNYTQVIEKAANYFASQKYRRAFDQIVGVDVKEKDQDLKDRIYTVMYVERLYESYNNNVAMGHEEKALDSLLRGVEKYYEHYQEAEELGITDDLNYSFNQIQQTLAERYGISVEQAQEINELDNLEYIQRIKMYVENLETTEAQ
jgi:hypothetical protein